MSTTTTNLSLTKPAVGEKVDVSILNTNSDTIDGAIGDLSALTTTEQGSLAGAINEVDAHADAAVEKATFNANTVLAATVDDTPAALEITEQTVLGRATSGNIAALAIDSDLSDVSTSDDTLPSAKATVAKVADTYIWRESTDNPASVYPVPESALHVQAAGTYTQAGSGDPSPSNIRVPSPWVEEDDVLTVVRTGKNLFNLSTAESGRIDSSTGADVSDANYVRSDYVLICESTDYIISWIGTYSTATVAAYFYDAEVGYLSYQADTNYTSPFAFTSPANAKYVRFRAHVGINISNADNAVQLELGSSATAYEAYSGAEVPITAPADIWSGWLNNDGEGEDEYVHIVYDGTENWTVANTGTANWYYTIAADNADVVNNASSIANAVCSHYPWGQIFNGTTTSGFGFVWSRIRVRYGSEDTAANWKAYLAAQYAAATPVEVVVERATALALTPTAAPLTSLAQVDRATPRNNVITLDTGDLTTQYADSALYNTIPYTNADKAIDLNSQTVGNVLRLGVGKAAHATYAVDLVAGGKIATNGDVTLYNANGTYTGSLFVGNGGGSLSHSAGNEGYYNIGIGLNALEDVASGYNNIGVGADASKNVTTGYNNAAIGIGALNNTTVGNSNYGIGRYALYSSVSGSNGIAIGAESQRYANDTATPWTNYNTSVGYQALRGSTTAADNTGNYNTALGYQSLLNNTSGEKNISIGYLSLVANTSGGENTAIGYQALNGNTTASDNTSVGYAALGAVVGAYSSNTAIGSLAGRYYGSSYDSLTQSTQSTFLGSNSRASANTQTNEIVIGYNAIGAGSNKAVLGNSSVTDVYLGSATPAAKIHAASAAIGDGTNQMLVAADGEITLEGTARVYKNEWMDIGGFKAPGANPASEVAWGIWSAWSFADSDEDTVVGIMRVPQDMDRSVAPELKIGYACGTAGDGSKYVEWQLEYLWLSANESTQGAAQETLNTSNTAVISTTQYGLGIATITGIDVPSATDQLLMIRITRLGNTDDIGQAVVMLGCGLKYTANALGVAL